MKKIIPTLAVIAVAGILVSCGATTPEQIPLSPKVPAPAAEVTPVTDPAPVAPAPVAPVPAVEMNVTASGVSVNGSGVTAPGVVVTENSITAPGVMVTASGVIAPGVMVSETNGTVATSADANVTVPSADVDAQMEVSATGTTTSSN